MKKYYLKIFLTIIIPILVIFFNFIIIIFPYEMISAAKEGLLLWVNNIIPSLLPFIIGTNILMGLGVINFIGKLIEPIMYKVFRVPGIGGFALISGMTSGYPMGSKIISTIREEKQITKIEAQRLISFANNSGPLFILGAVGLGMFKSASVGYFIMIIHYTSAIITGILFRYYKVSGEIQKNYNNKNLIRNAYISMKSAKDKDGRGFGQLLGDSVGNAMQSMLQIGGFIIIFCVLVEAIKLMNIILILEVILYPILNIFNISSNVFTGFIVGIIEVTNGTKLIASEEFTRSHVLSVAMLISFGGFSIHAQSINFISKTDINIFVYICSKVIHSLITFVLGFMLYPFFELNRNETVTTFNIYNQSIFNDLFFSSLTFIISILLVLASAIFLNIFIRFNKYK